MYRIKDFLDSEYREQKTKPIKELVSIKCEPKTEVDVSPRNLNRADIMLDKGHEKGKDRKKT